MSQVCYRHPDGHESTVEVASGASIMQAAISRGIAGIVAECGGQLMCATCHVYVESSDGELPVQSEDEQEMLKLAASPPDDTSRLSCQLVMNPGITVVTVRLPEAQI